MPEVDQRSSRVITYCVCFLALAGMGGSFALVWRAMGAPTKEEAIALMGVSQSFFGMSTALIGALINAMTIRSGSNTQQLKEVTGVVRGESMSAGYLGNVEHDPEHPTAQMFANAYVEPNADPSTPGPTVPTGG